MLGEMQAGQRTLPVEVRLRRVRRVGALFEYLTAHDRVVSRTLGRAAVAAGVGPLTRGRVYSIRSGTAPTPEWLVPEVCAALGQETGEVMGDAWLAEFGEEVDAYWRTKAERQAGRKEGAKAS